ncbi:MAG: P-loop NTPase fold protein, partial [Promethearchaeota archaeon]
MDGILNTPEINQLYTLVEEAARATPEGTKRFVEPLAGTLSRAISRRHHIVFGRRGSGKTSLLRKAAADLTLDRRPIAFVNLDVFKAHSYPDVLISVLIATLTYFKEWLETTAVHPSTKKSFWRKWFETRPTRGAFNREKANQLGKDISSLIKDLKDQLHAADNVEIQKMIRGTQESAFHGEMEGQLDAPGVGRVASKVGRSDRKNQEEQVQEFFRRSKIDFLHRHIMEYIDIFRRLAEFSEGDSFLFLDDLYQIRRDDQAPLLDYFHRIAKGNGLWLKIGTIRHQSRLYVHGNPPIGLNIRDDADEIDLDLTLEKYSRTKSFLVKILNELIEECAAPPATDLLTDGAIDRLVLASGGVARDFLGIFRRSIEEALERLQRDPTHGKGPRIFAEDVNQAAGTYGDSKMQDFRIDAFENQQGLLQVFDRIRDFCMERKANCFLLDQDSNLAETDLIDELVDLRLVHLVRSGLTVSGRT